MADRPPDLVRALSLLGLREVVTELGGDLDALAREIGLESLINADPQHFISARQSHELVNHVAQRLRRPDFGLVWGSRSDPSRLGPLHVALTNARTGREAVQFLARFLQVNFPTGEVQLLPHDDASALLTLRSLLRRPPPLIHLYERRVASIHMVLKLICGMLYRPVDVRFTHAITSSPAAYKAVFGIVPTFDAAENGIVIPREALDAARPQANPQLREMATSFLRMQMPASEPRLAPQTAHIVRILMRSSECSAADTAHALSMGTRTFQRRLEMEGASFECIKDEVRKEMAEEMLRDPSLTITAIAFALHYENASSLTRSCHRWFGASPSEVKRAWTKAQTAKVA